VPHLRRAAQAQGSFLCLDCKPNAGVLS
jgi:hypothetical protein